MPEVSVLIAAYNSERYLAEALDSILAQTFRDFEVLVINDGSTDKTAGILDSYAARDSRIRAIHQENMGRPKARNQGLKRARGRYIAVMDADDISWPDRLSAQVAFLEANPGIVAVGTQFRLIDPEGRLLRTLSVPESHDDIDAELIRHHGLVICHPSSMIRTDAIARIGGYDESMPVAQDVDLWLRLGEVGKLANMADVLFDYRLHSASAGYTKRKKQVELSRRAVEAAAARRGIPIPPVTVTQNGSPSQAEIFRRWGWWALMDGNVATARHYAWKSLQASPLSAQSWKLAVMALRGY